MSEMTMPEWIKREVSAQDDLKLHNEAVAQKQLADSLKIKDGGPEFVRQLIKELTFHIEHLPKLGIRGQLSEVSNSELEEAYQVRLTLAGQHPIQTYTNVFYSKGSSTIRCYTLEGIAFEFSLCIRPDGGIGAWDDQMMWMTPEKTAQVIVKRMADMIRSSHN